MVDKVVQFGRRVDRLGQGESAAPTAERHFKALEAGQEVRERGEGEERHWRISPILDELKRRGTLSAEEYRAAQRFLKDYFLGMYAGPRGSSYRERGSPGADESDHETRRIHHAREAQKALKAIDPMYFPAMAWLIASLGEGMPLSALGAHYAPTLGVQTQSARGGQALAFACIHLCRHYGMQHRLDVERRIGDLSKLFLENLAG